MEERVRNRLKAEDLNNEGCLNLAVCIIEGINDEVRNICKDIYHRPNDKNVLNEYRSIRNVIASDYYDGISMWHSKEALANFDAKFETARKKGLERIRRKGA